MCEAVFTLTGMIRMFDFPLCQVHGEGNWFLAILVGTNLGGLMAKEDAFI